MKSSDTEYRKGCYRVILHPDHVAREGDCRDCWYLRGAVTWWCKNSSAIEHHGTMIPGRTNCTFWSEARRVTRIPRTPADFDDRLQAERIVARAILGVCLVLLIIGVARFLFGLVF